MKKFLIAISTAINLGLIGLVFYQQSKLQNQTFDKNLPTKNIAIFTPATHPSLQAIEDGFRKTMKQDNSANYAFTTYNANANRTLMRSQAEEIIQGNYDLVFTIGAQATQMSKTITQKKNIAMPVVFAAVSEPIQLKLIKSYASSGNNLTGVSEDRDFGKQVDILHYLKPGIKHVTLVYNPSEGAGLEKQKNEIKKYLQTKDITLLTLEVYHSNEIYQKVSSSIDSTDVVMVLKDNTVVAAIDSLIKLCNQHGVLLYASDLDSVDKGAAAAFGVQEIDYGIEGAEKALAILNKGKQATEVPTTKAKKFTLKVNTKMMGKQGLNLNENQLFLMRSCEVVD